MTEMKASMPAGSILGHPVLRTEDPRFLTGSAMYTEDLAALGAVHVAFVRAPLAHARIEEIDADAALSMPGVVGVFTAQDLELPPIVPGECREEFARPPLAREVVRFLGEAVAVVVADTRARAIDAAETVLVEYEPLPVLIDPAAATDPGAPVLFETAGNNVAAEDDFESAPVSLDDADVVVRGHFVNQRLVPAPMEVNGALAVPGAGEVKLSVWLPCQAPFWVREDLAEALSMEEKQIRVVAPAVGGGFGAKIPTYPEHIVVAALASRLGKGVRWTETRSESFLAMGHGRAQIQEFELGAKRDGTIVGLRLRLVQDGGAYPDNGGEMIGLTHQMSSGVYRVPVIECTAICVATNTTPTVAYRGAGRPEAAAMIERAMDMLAHELDLDPVEVRRRNFITSDEFPYVTASDARYDIGDYEKTLDEALRLGGYDIAREEQERRRASSDPVQLGVGMSTYVEVTGFGSEFGGVEIRRDGTAIVRSGVSPHGQGHETAFAQIASGVLGIPLESVTVIHSDTTKVLRGDGTMGSRSLQKGGSAVFNSSQTVLRKAKEIAGHQFEVSVDDVVLLGDSRLGVAGVPDKSMSWSEVAAAAFDPGRLPDGMDPGLDAATDFQSKGDTTYPFGSHLAVVEVDTETGAVRLLRHIAVDDCGRIINPVLVEGQVHGGIAQGVAQALFEQAVYDDDGNLLTGSLATYAMPSAAELPTFETMRTETPTALNPLGAKGIGESATIGSTPAVQNAVIDALYHLGVHHIDMPLTPERVWRAVNRQGGKVP